MQLPASLQVEEEYVDTYLKASFSSFLLFAGSGQLSGSLRRISVGSWVAGEAGIIPRLLGGAQLVGLIIRIGAQTLTLTTSIQVTVCSICPQ